MDEKKKPVDTANEPVERIEDDELMDTGVLHEKTARGGHPKTPDDAA